MGVVVVAVVTAVVGEAPLKFAYPSKISLRFAASIKKIGIHFDRLHKGSQTQNCTRAALRRKMSLRAKY